MIFQALKILIRARPEKYFRKNKLFSLEISIYPDKIIIIIFSKNYFLKRLVCETGNIRDRLFNLLSFSFLLSFILHSSIFFTFSILTTNSLISRQKRVQCTLDKHLYDAKIYSMWSTKKKFFFFCLACLFSMHANVNDRENALLTTSFSLFAFFFILKTNFDDFAFDDKRAT